MSNDISFYKKNEVIVVKPGSEMTIRDVKEAADFLKANIEEGVYRFIFDLTDTRWIDSMGMSIIAMTLRVSIMKKKKVSLINPGENITNLLELNSLLKLVMIFDSLEKAEDYLREK